MRHFTIVFLLALASVLPAVTAASYDITAVPQVSISGGLALTSTETTITLTDNLGTARVVQFTCDQDWGIATATGNFASKQAVSANVPYTIVVSATTTVFYVQASSSSGTIKTSVLDAVARQ